MNELSDSEWEEVDRLFDEALDRPPQERAAFLEEACGGRPALREEVEALLEMEADSSAFLEQEAVSFAAPAYEPDEGESIAEDPLAAPGRRVGGYQLKEEIGRGGMSRVFRAVRTDGRFDQTVAVKLLRIGLDTEEARRRFRLEQQVLAKLQHAHIASFLDGGLTEDDVPYLVMEYVDGQPLTTYCDDNALPISERLDLLDDVGTALQHAHKNLVVHRDLKPSNVLVTEDGTVKLLDFGIAKLLDEAESSITLPQTRTDVRPMTPAYAAPEQVRNDSVSTATDVYQLGVLSYEVLTGRRPFETFEESDTKDIETAILETAPKPPSVVVTDPPPRAGREDCTDPATPEAISEARGTTPRELCHQLEGDLNQIVQKALRKEEDRRYASVEAFLADVNRYREGIPIQARPASMGYRVRKFLQRHRWGVAIGTAFMGLVLTFGVLLVQQRERAQQEAKKAEIVSSYLVDLFNSGAPYGVRDTVTAQTLVQRGLDRVERLRDRPIVQAEMLDALGQASQGIGEWEQADSLLTAALLLRRQHLKAPHSDLVESLVHVADTRWIGRRYWEARPLYEEALSMNRDLSTSRPQQQADILEGLAQTMSRQGTPDSAEVLMRQAIDLRRQNRDDGNDQYHGLPLDQMELARIVQEQGKHGEAEELYRAALWKMEEKAGYTSAEQVVAYNNFGDLLHKKGESAAAATYYRKALRITVENMGEGHPRARRSRADLYQTLIERGQYEDALSVAQSNLDVMRRLYGTSHPAVPKAYQQVGHLLDNIGASAEAEPLLWQSVRLHEQIRGEDHIWTHNARLYHALCLVERGQLEKAEKRFERGETVVQSTPADSTTVDLHRMKAVLHVGKGRLYAEWNQWEAAVRHLKRGYRYRRQQVGLRAPLCQRALRALAEVHEAAGRPRKASTYRDSLMTRQGEETSTKADRILESVAGS